MTQNNDMPDELYITKWQPIETAPKDGTRIIGFQKIPNSYADSGYSTFVSIVAYKQNLKLWDYDDAHGHRYPKHLTHWMPLPPEMI